MTKRRNQFLIVRLRVNEKFPFFIPLSLSVLHETAEEALDWLRLWRVFFGRLGGYQKAVMAVAGVKELIGGMRGLGKVNLVEVELPDVRVHIDLV